MSRMNPMMFQSQLEEVLNAGKGSLVIGGDLSRHNYLTRAKTEEVALKEQQDAKLQTMPPIGFMFSVKNAQVVSGAGRGTIMEQIVASGIKPGKDGDTYVECRAGHRMPRLYTQDANGAFVDISSEFEGKPVSYQGPVQVCYSLSKGKKDGRVYLNVDGVLFAAKPDIYVPEDNPTVDASAAFAGAGFYGQAAAPAAPAGFQAAPQTAPTGFQTAPAQPTTGFTQAAPTQPAQAQAAAPSFVWPQ